MGLQGWYQSSGFVGPHRVDVVKHKMDHLSCFIPAMLALGAHAGAVTGEKAGKYMQVAEELTHTCWQMYHQMPSGMLSTLTCHTPFC